MTKIYIAFYDEEEGNSRENWSTFYTPWVASLKSEEDATQLAQAEINKIVSETIKNDCGVDIATVDLSTLSEDVQEEIEYEMNRFVIDVQSGEIA